LQVARAEFGHAKCLTVSYVRRPTLTLLSCLMDFDGCDQEVRIASSTIEDLTVNHQPRFLFFSFFSPVYGSCAAQSRPLAVLVGCRVPNRRVKAIALARTVLVAQTRCVDLQACHALGKIPTYEYERRLAAAKPIKFRCHHRGRARSAPADGQAARRIASRAAADCVCHRAMFSTRMQMFFVLRQCAC
jgi:hypothetical protein